MKTPLHIRKLSLLVIFLVLSLAQIPSGVMAGGIISTFFPSKERTKTPPPSQATPPSLLVAASTEEGQEENDTDEVHEKGDDTRGDMERQLGSTHRSDDDASTGDSPQEPGSYANLRLELALKLYMAASAHPAFKDIGIPPELEDFLTKAQEKTDSQKRKPPEEM